MNICVLIYSTCYVQLQPLLNTYYTYTNTTYLVHLDPGTMNYGEELSHDALV